MMSIDDVTLLEGLRGCRSDSVPFSVCYTLQLTVFSLIASVRMERAVAWSLMASAIAVFLVGVVSEQRVCYFGPPPEPDPDHPEDWKKQVMREIRKRCPGRGQAGGVCSGDQEGLLGMEDGRIPDGSITASSIYRNRATHGPTSARLNNQVYSSAWCNDDATDNTSPGIQVDFNVTVTITGLITQGRGDHDQSVTEYNVTYSDDCQSWNHVTDAVGTSIKFPGNEDRNTMVTSRFPVALRTRILRIHPDQWSVYCCMRFEVIGCY